MKREPVTGARGKAKAGGGLRAEPPAGSRDRAPSQGVGAKPPKAETFLFLDVQPMGKICHILYILLIWKELIGVLHCSLFSATCGYLPAKADPDRHIMSLRISLWKMRSACCTSSISISETVQAICVTSPQYTKVITSSESNE